MCCYFQGKMYKWQNASKAARTGFTPELQFEIQSALKIFTREKKAYFHFASFEFGT